MKLKYKSGRYFFTFVLVRQISSKHSSLAATLIMVLIPVSVTSILTMGSAMPMPMSALLYIESSKNSFCLR
nr:MAG TPA: hypothetical protein [Caudoviricetes sp.]